MNVISVDKLDWNSDLLVHWKISDVCNYNCSYCEPSNHRTIDIKNINSAEKLISGLANIKKAAGDRSVQLILTGGEPFLIPGIDRFLAKISEYQFKLIVFTNGSMPLKIYNKCLPFLKTNTVVCISFHPETANIDNIINIAQLFKDNTHKMEVRAMLAAGHFEKVKELTNRLEKENDIGVNCLIVYPLVHKVTGHIHRLESGSSRDLKDYTQNAAAINQYYSTEELDFINYLEQDRKTKKTKKNKKNFAIEIQLEQDGQIITESSSAYNLMMKNINSFRGWKCAVATKKAAIDPNGDVKFGICNSQSKIVGNVFDQGFEFENDYITCSVDRCTTIDEIMIKKFKV